MKKTLIALMALAGIACGAEAYSYTWDFTNDDNAQLGGTSVAGEITTQEEEINGITSTVLTNGQYAEYGSDVLYNLAKSAMAGEVVLTFSAQVCWGGNTHGTTGYETILHVGAKDEGFTIGIAQGSLVFAPGNSWNAGKIAKATLTEDTWHDVSFTLSEGKTSVTIDGTEYTGNAIGLTWNANDGENKRYSIGVEAPGWPGYLLTSNGSKIANLSVSAVPVPEPATATLSLLALAGLAARRRRH